jgi:hypothetical protein
MGRGSKHRVAGVECFEAGSDFRDELSLGAGTVRFSIIRTNGDSRAKRLFA